MDRWCVDPLDNDKRYNSEERTEQTEELHLAMMKRHVSSPLKLLLLL
jgi:hypothetical protein